MTKATIEIPKKLIPVFSPPRGSVRFRWAYGGRGSAKTRTFALMSAIRAYELEMAGESGVILCAREFQNSLDESSMEEVKQAIRSVDWLNDFFDVGERYIRTNTGRVKYVFAGLRHNLDSIKSKAKILLCWIDEAEPVSEKAYQKLLPTIREEGSECWVTWNPERLGSPTDNRFIHNPPDSGVGTQINWHDNPFLPNALEDQRKRDHETLDINLYAWIWEGAYLEQTDAQILAHKVRVESFEPDKKWDGPYHGLDYGFAQDPTACIRCWIFEDTLYIEYEAGGVGLELDETAELLKDQIPNIEQYVIRADNARPESTSYLKRHGLPRITSVDKWGGSVQDGIEHLKTYREIVIHPRCQETIRESRLYSYKVDRQTGDIMPKIVDEYNHYFDACFSGDTLVYVNNNLIRFDQIPEEGYVTGINGNNVPYIDGGLIRYDAICNVMTENGKIIRCTPDHEFLTTQGWVQARNLKGHYICESKLFQNTNKNLMEKFINDTEIKNISQKDVINYIESYGNTIMAIYLKIIPYTTKITTSQITRFKILNLCINLITKAITLNYFINEILNLQENKYNHAKTNVENGTKVKKAENGISNILSGTDIRYSSNMILNVIIAENILSALKSKADSAQTSVNQDGDVIINEIMKQELANIAYMSTALINSCGIDFVQNVVQDNQEIEPTYCLTVPNDGAFCLANGCVVSNCRYALSPIIKNKNNKLLAMTQL